MKYVYGPVPSRRLGRSLGIDPIPFKTCNWNCVYCQLGRTSPLVLDRREYFPTSEILAEVKEVLQRHLPGEIDWLTFVGSGEPTLHANLGYMLRDLKGVTSIPLAVITNGSLLHLPALRQELLVADAVLPSVDAGTEYLYQKINRPMPALDFAGFIDGIIAFRNEYLGHLWVEVMLVQGLNDTEKALCDLAAVLERIRPDEVHLNSPTRAPCEPWVKPVDDDVMSRAQRILGAVTRVVRPRDGAFDFSGFENVVDAVVAIVQRHPIREDDLLLQLNRWAPEHVRETLESLAQGGKVAVVTRDGHRHWTYAGARYVEQATAGCQPRPSPEKGELP